MIAMSIMASDGSFVFEPIVMWYQKYRIVLNHLKLGSHLSKKCFLFILKTLFVLEQFKFLF